MKLDITHRDVANYRDLLISCHVQRFSHTCFPLVTTDRAILKIGKKLVRSLYTICLSLGSDVPVVGSVRNRHMQESKSNK